jgi:hypothetical protein
MRTDLKRKPFTREIVALSRAAMYNPGPIPFFAYYYDDHDELLAKLQIMENYGAIVDARRNSVPRYNFTEDFADFLLGAH